MHEIQSKSEFTVRLAETDRDLAAAQALRYEVFVRELGSGGALVDHLNGLEKDEFDPFFDHLLVIDNSSDRVVGVYRLLRSDQAERIGRFYSEDEYDLTRLKSSGRKLLELGRSCLHRDFRGGMAMYHLWNGLSRYVEMHQIDILFGVASFHGADLSKLKEPLSLLHQSHLAPEDLRVKALPNRYEDMNLISPELLDRRQAMISMPALIKAYLRLGGFVGEGACIDHAFNTTDVCLILDTSRMNARQKRLYSGDRKG